MEEGVVQNKHNLFLCDLIYFYLSLLFFFFSYILLVYFRENKTEN